MQPIPNPPIPSESPHAHVLIIKTPYYKCTVTEKEEEEEEEEKAPRNDAYASEERT